MGGACSAYGERTVVYTYLVKTLKERNELGATGVHGRLMDLQEVGCVGIDGMELTQDRDSWRARVSVYVGMIFRCL